MKCRPTARLQKWARLVITLALAGMMPVIGCVEERPAQADGGNDAMIDAENGEASVELDAGVDAADASVFCPHILMRQTETEPLAHGPGTFCGPSCKQVTFADSVEKTYDVWGDYVVYTTSFSSGSVHHAYMANVVTGEEWRLETGPWNQGGCTGIAVDDGVVSWAYARAPSQGPYIVELLRTYDLTANVYQDLACIEHQTEETQIIFGYDLAGNTLSFSMSDECLGCTDLYTVSLIDGVPVKRTNLGVGVIETRAGGDLAVWTDLNQFNTEIMAFDVQSGETTNLSNNDADQWRSRVGGGKVVWVDHRNDAGGYYHQRNSDIYYYDLATGQTQEACTDPALQDQPDIDGDVVVWGDWRNNPIPIPVYASEFENSDIYMKRISTDEEIQLTDFPGMEYYPRVKGNRVYFMMGDDNNVLSVFMIELEP